MSKTYLITGGAGNLACQVTFPLAERGVRAVLCDVATRPTAAVAAGCLFERADVTRREQVATLLERHRPDAILHFASLLSGQSEEDRPLAWRVNVDGAFGLLEEAVRHGVSKFFFLSSVAAYGGALPCPVSEDYPQWPEGLYGVTKLVVERLGYYYHRRFGLDFRCLRLPVVVSPYAPAGAASAYASRAFVEAVREGRYVFRVWPCARPSLIYVKDALTAIVGLLEAPTAQLTRRVYNIQALSPTAQQLADVIRNRLPEAELTFAPQQAVADLIASWPIEFEDAAARRDWGWRPRFDLETMTDDFLAVLSK